MKFKTFLTMYRNLIILLWWIIVILVFKLTINFKFHHGLSLVFIALMAILPIFLYIFTSIHRKKLINRKKIRKLTYFNRIKKDYQNKIFEKEFLNPLKKNIGQLDFSYSEEKIEIKNEQFIISFYPTKAILEIIGTKVKYNYYYTHKYDNLSFYDTKFVQYHDTEYLYDTIIQKLDVLSKEELLYQEGNNCCRLTSSDEKTTFFTLNSVKKKKSQYSKSTIIQIKNNQK